MCCTNSGSSREGGDAAPSVDVYLHKRRLCMICDVCVDGDGCSQVNVNATEPRDVKIIIS